MINEQSIVDISVKSDGKAKGAALTRCDLEKCINSEHD